MRGLRVVVAVLIGVALGVFDAAVLAHAGATGSGTWRAASIVSNFALIWAGVAVLAGWIVARWALSALAGLLALLGAVLAYYAYGVQYASRTWEEVQAATVFWSVVALVGGPLLGLVGAACHRPGALGVLARLVLPLGLVAQVAWRLRWGLPTGDRANAAALVALLLLAVVLAVWAMLPRRAGPAPVGGRTAAF